MDESKNNMEDNSSFEELAISAAMGELDREKQDYFDKLIESDAKLRQEYSQILETHGCMQTLGAVQSSLDATSPRPSEQQIQKLMSQLHIEEPPPSEKSPTTSYKRNIMIIATGGIAAAIIFMAGIQLGQNTGLPTQENRPSDQQQEDLFSMRGGNNEDSTSPPSESTDKQPVGFIMSESSNMTIQRQDDEIPGTVGEAVYVGDVLQLPKNQKALILTQEGEHTIEGPLEYKIKKTSGLKEVATSNQTDDPSASGFRGESSSGQSSTPAYGEFLFTPPSEALATASLNVQRNAAEFELHSPTGEIAILNPNIVWEDEKGETYEIVLKNMMDNQETYRATAKKSPLSFSELSGSPEKSLQPGSIYELTIQKQNSRFGGAQTSFMTADEARILTTSNELIPAIKASRQKENWGNMLTLIYQLPRAVRESPLMLRWALLAHSQLGHEKASERLTQKRAEQE